MLHKTLRSYHREDAWPEKQQHPDGPLWLIHPEEYDKLPSGVRLENVDGIFFTKPDGITKARSRTPFEREHGYMSWGLRGR